MDEKQAALKRIRHSLAHVLAQAMQTYRPGTLLGFGPDTDDGFYYDFILPEPIGEDDLPAIQKLMEQIVKEKQEFTSEDLPIEQAFAKLDAMQEPHKREYAEELVAKRNLDTLRFYTNGPFVDMCEGPHIESTAKIAKGCFKLRMISNAYWRADESRESMTRVYGWAFENKKALRVYEKAREEAKKRDHRKLGAELDLYVIDPKVGKGLPLWLPNGTVLCDELEQLAREWEFADGYQRVRTPHLTRGELYHQSGHLALYKDSMFPGMLDTREEHEHPELEALYLKPMNCPHHHQIFKARRRSYRDLPLRLAEYGTVYRYERSGTLQGLTRVRGMCMNDAHIYLMESQITEEFVRVMDLHKRYYELFGLTNYHLRLSLWDPEDPKARNKYVDDPANWEKTEALVRQAMLETGMPFEEVKGEAAFYGPKVDVQMKTVGLQEFTISTNQLDFAVPAPDRMNLVYTDKDGQETMPYCIHRAPLGTHERFVSFLIEHYAGAFPTWLAPVQVRVLPVSEKYLDYAEKVNAELRLDFVRAEVDRSSEKLGKKIALSRNAKIPIMLIIGEQEQADGTVTVRRRGIKDQRTLKVAQLRAQLRAEIKTRTHVQAWEDLDAVL